MSATGTRLPASARAADRWVIDRIARDFKLLDVWALPAEGAAADFDALLETLASFDPAGADSTVVRALFEVRLRVGGWLGWDDPGKERAIPGCAEASLADRLPDDLRGSATGPVVGGAMERAAGGFTPLYRTGDEWAAEISNETVHGVLHLAWVEGDDGRYRGQLAVYVKPRGPLGEIYLKAIEPFRRFVVYPVLLRQIGRAWEARTT